ncbi:MAG: ThiF family adenylyltransferase [Nitrospirae bacterium]|nr:ThiF family adenylyltransferase [Nitrospirota bacterium]
MNSLSIPSSIWEKTRDHLLKDGMEHFAFFLAGFATHENGTSFSVKDVVLLHECDLNFSFSSHSMLKLDALLRITNLARSRKLALVEAHSHPFTKNDVRFSSIDVDGLKEFAPYMLDDLPGFPYAATVWGTESIDGIYWRSDKKTSNPISEVRVIGQNIKRIVTSSGKKSASIRRENENVPEDMRYNRQILAIGKDGQEKMSSVRVAIAGAGGIGSHVIQQLAYLGVKNFVVIDADNVEKSNLNRLVGATPSDIGRPKAWVMERMIRSIDGYETINVRIINRFIRDPDSVDALREADVIFGCVDNDGARLILNEIALAYLIPLIDCGVGIEARNGEITEAGGRVMLVHPDGPCLLCAKEVNYKEASNDLAPLEELEMRKKLGYVSGEEVLSPSVISLNGTIASIACTEFIAMVTGMRSAREFTFYDMFEQRIVPRILKPDPKCFHCSLKAIGDKTNIHRYNSNSIPKDIPRV